jgi:hypothetical protein
MVLPSGCYTKCVVQDWSTGKFDEDAKGKKCTKEQIKQFTDEYECTAQECALKMTPTAPSPTTNSSGSSTPSSTTTEVENAVDNASSSSLSMIVVVIISILLLQF